MIDDCGGKGELEKRLRKWEDFRINGSLRLPIYNMLEIVGEMRKEFPKLMIFGKADDSSLTGTEKALTHCYEWFLKWLGDEP